jgi:glycosyltransferase involved in cell wall biosynthesis
MSDGVIALSNEWKELTKMVTGSQVHVLQNAIHLAPYQGIAQDRFNNLYRNRDVHFLYLGYIGQAKGSLDLLEAARLIESVVDNASFDIVGDELCPGELECLRQMIAKTNLEHLVKHYPPVVDKEKLESFRKADVFVFPSHSEGLPIAVIEAMACGLPIIATNVGGLPDLVLDGINGILVEAVNPDQLADAICELSRNRKLRISMGMESYRIACDFFDIEQHVIELVSIYSTVLSDSSTG